MAHSLIATLLQVIGLALLAIVGLLLHPLIGLAVLGVEFFAAGLALERPVKAVDAE